MAKRSLLTAALFIAGSFLISAPFLNKAMAEKEESQRPRIDLAFCIDTTGSMQNEIDAVKSKTEEIVAKLSGAKPSPEIRVGLVAYRDRGDEYVTRVFQFSDNIDKVVEDISSLKADGGGDEPEAVNEALHAAVNDLSWSKEKKTVKLLFLVGDAGPKAYSGDYDWQSESKDAISRGIQINTIACDGLNRSSSGLDVFQQIAKLTDGKSEFLTYRQEIVNAQGKKSTVISSAGKLYSVDARAADSWRKGAGALMAGGAAAPIAMPAVAARSRSLPRAASYGVFAAAPSHSAHISGKMMKTDSYGDDSMGFAGVSRADSNLADIVLSATKDAAFKKAGIKYKD
ncbi:MAG: VWA domain-containing protein [Candidatus Obscuribacterales bacterium]|nr:VWA domain-containing protein [Candidatus Obscuribacterales bacterium]